MTTESTGTPGRQYTGDELRDLLVAGARSRGNLGIQGAVHLLTFTGLPDWRGFPALVDVELALHDRVHGETYDAAFVRWVGLVDATRAAHISATGRRLLALAVSMAAGVPVDLRDTLPGLGHAHARRVMEAVAIAACADDFYDVTPTPALDELLARQREMNGDPR